MSQIATDAESRIQTLASYIGIALVTLLLVITDLYNSHQQSISLAQRAETNLSLAMDAHINGILDKSNLILSEIVQDMRPIMAAGTEYGKTTEQRLNNRLAFLLNHLPESQSLRIVNAEGNVIFDASGTPPKGNIADREYFIENRDNPNVGLVVSGAIFARFTNNWVVTLSRQIRGDDGRFLGLVQAAIRADYFEKYYSTLSTGKNGILSLYDRDFKNFARAPHMADFTGTKKISPELAALLEQNVREAFYFAHSASDNVYRLLRIQRSDRHPFMIIVGLSMREVLAEWYQRCAIDLSIIAVLYYLLWFVYDNQRRRYDQAVEIAEAMTHKALQVVEEGRRSQHNFLAVVSHEFKTPLNGIMGMTDLLKYTGLQEDQVLPVQDIQSSALRLQSMIDDVLDYLAIEHGKTTNEAGEYSLADLFESLSMSFAQAASEKGLSFVTDIAPALSDLQQGNEAHLKRILGIFVSNAIKFTKQGTVELQASALLGGGLSLSISDTGCGIPSEKLARLFKLFSQANEGETRSHEGLGLGLCLAEKLAEVVSGRLEVESQEGQGSRFSLVIEHAGEPTATLTA